ncbi:MAG: efflux RND transporter periplasmic adaptor subunit [Elioraea sp.]|nr:efflux RND transporter periplasmic adaptor subunit [Elioraea sp.]
MRRPLPLTALLAILLAVATTALAQQQPPAPAVGVVVVERRSVADSASFVGRVSAVDTVQIVARVTGFLRERTFREGQEVKAGDLLFMLEREPFEAAYAARKAELASAQAAALNADLQLARAEELVRTNNIPVATRDQRRAEAEMARARVQEAEAALRIAEIDLGYTLIVAPFAGRIGRSAVSVGAVVSPQSGPLATLTSVDPMHVTFRVSQREVLEYQRRRRGNGSEAQAAEALSVRIRLADGSAYPHEGRIDFIDPQIDRGTDTQAVRAVVPNPERMLFDGATVSVEVAAKEPRRAIVIPRAALLADREGQYVFVVDDQGRAAVRRVRVGETTPATAEIVEGLRDGENLVVEGIQRLRAGIPVQAGPATAPAPSLRAATPSR